MSNRLKKTCYYSEKNFTFRPFLFLCFWIEESGLGQRVQRNEISSINLNNHNKEKLKEVIKKILGTLSKLKSCEIRGFAINLRACERQYELVSRLTGKWNPRRIEKKNWSIEAADFILICLHYRTLSVLFADSLITSKSSSIFSTLQRLKTNFLVYRRSD